MATSHPYISGAGNIAQMVAHLRKSFPSTINSDLLKKLQLAPNNESYVINALHFVGVIDEAGKKTEAGSNVFNQHDDDAFASKFKELVEKAYSGLKDVHGEAMWTLDKGKLIGYFRNTDQTGAVIGSRQAGVFQTFAKLSGFNEIELPTRSAKLKNKTSVSATPAKTNPAKVNLSTKIGQAEDNETEKPTRNQGMALTVRVEINLPSGGSKDDYDNIFKSIRANLLNE